MMVGFPGPHCPYDPSPEFLRDINTGALPAPVPEVVGDTPELRRRNVEGNRQSWNGVDYTEFSLEQKLKIRAHYAALVSQIDYEVGKIIEALSRQELLERTIIVFASDHGDYLGDHNLIGKGSFFESSIHVPLLVSIPWLGESRLCEELVNLGDVTATMLRIAGCEVPSHMDSVPLPDLGISCSAPRDCIIGTTSGGWMIYDGEWRLCKYSTGEAVLFNVRDDPGEQHNLTSDPAYLDVRINLDMRLDQAIMRSIGQSTHDRRVYTSDLSQDPWFGREGWQRPYPRRMHR
jgi:arylsulfatase A-like enzyme